MKHLKHFKIFEAVIMPSKIESNSEIHSFESAVEYGIENDFDVVEYDEFYNSLGEGDKKTAPPRRGGPPFFALFHPVRKKPMFVICDRNVFMFMPMKNIINDIIGHEKVHAEQTKRRGGIEFALPSPTDRKAYFSNKEEIMAFSWTIANGLSKTNKSLESSMKELDAQDIRTMGTRPTEHKMLWNDIKINCDEKTIKRYRKYIYMYLDKIFNKDEDSKNV
jgi:hypothetical protein